MSGLPLTYHEQPNPPKRPTRANKAVCRAAAELLLPEIINWYGAQWQEAEQEQIIADLMQVVTLCDAYEAARDLEDLHWDPDAALVEILDGSYIWRAEEQAVKTWVAANLITPKLAVGDVVSTRDGSGPIVAINQDTATYTVQTGDFLKRYPDQAGKISGIVLPYESVTAIKPEVA